MVCASHWGIVVRGAILAESPCCVNEDAEHNYSASQPPPFFGQLPGSLDKGDYLGKARRCGFAIGFPIQ